MMHGSIIEQGPVVGMHGVVRAYATVPACLHRLATAFACVLVALLICAVLAGSAGADCIDYADYLRWVGDLDTQGSAADVALVGDYLYVADYDRLTVVDVSDPDSPQIAGFASTFGSDAVDVVVSGEYAYLACYDGELCTFYIANPSSPVQAGTYNTTYDGYWPDDSIVVGDYLYVTYYSTPGFLLVFDITSPAAPVLVESLSALSGPQGMAASGNYLFLCNGQAGLTVIDITDPTSLQIVGGVDTPGDATDVEVAGNYAYLADWDGGLQVVAITNPLSPEIVGTLVVPSIATHVVLRDDRAYLETSGLSVIDITDPAAPQLLGDIAIGGTNRRMEVVGSRAFLTGNLYGLRMVDFSNLATPPIVGELDTPAASCHGVAQTGSYACLANGASGLRVVNVSNPVSPQIVGTLDTPGTCYGVLMSAGTAFVADGSSGLQIVNVSNPASPVIAGTANTPGIARGVAVSGNYAYVADSGPLSAELQVVNISAAPPQIVGSLDALGTGSAFEVAVSGSYAYLTDGGYGLLVIDVSNPASPQLVCTVDTPGSAWDVDLSGHHAFVADGSGGLQVIDISSPTSAQIVGSFLTLVEPVSVAVSGNVAYLGDAMAVQVLDVTDPESPKPIGSITRRNVTSNDIAVGADYLYVADSEGLRVLSLQCDPNVSVDEGIRPSTMMLDHGAPNPFALSTSLSYTLPERGHSRLSIFDPAGREVRLLRDADEVAGPHVARWDGRGDNGKLLPAGVYFVRVRFGDREESGKIVLKR
jgi:hypothetical protein